MDVKRVDLSQYVVASIWWGCNNRCTICMLSGVPEILPPIEYGQFKRLLMHIIDQARFRKLILSGAEVTTFKKLEQYVRFASSLGWFEKIQIQTNGRRLHDRAYVERLVAAGVNEFFVSIYGVDGVHDTVAGISGAYGQVMDGFANLAACDVNVISNTVLTSTNLRNIPRLMEILATGVASEIHMWNFFPMGQTDTRDLVVSASDFARLLGDIVPIANSSGKPLVLKGFPECLPVEAPAVFDGLFPVTVLPDAFWKAFEENQFGQCPYRAECSSRTCWGLSSAHIRKYGNEKHLLTPFSRGKNIGTDGTFDTW